MIGPMNLRFLFIIAVLVCPLAKGQGAPPPVVDIVDEPHHRLLLNNPSVRVFRLHLQSNEATLLHSHKSFYAFISLRPVIIGNEVYGRQPVQTQLEANELRTSKGGFTLAERNDSAEPADLIVIEPMKTDDGEDFSKPMGRFRLHNAAFGDLLESPVVRGYTLAIASGGRVEMRHEDHDRLLIALSDLSLREETNGQANSTLQMKAGEVRWVEGGMTHATANVGTSPAALLTLEFR